VSVIIPTFNNAEFIGKAVKSVLNQSYNNIELIVIDDGSTDNTKEIVTRIDDRRLKYYYQPNQERCVARNNGIEKSHGKYISFLDSDDYYLKNKIKNEVKFLTNNFHADMVVSGFRRVGENNKVIREKRYPNNKFIPLSDFIYGNPFSPCSTMIKSEYVKKVDGFDEELKAGEDWDFHFRLAMSGCAIVAISQIASIYRFRKHAVQKTSAEYCQRMAATQDKILNDVRLPQDLIALKNRAKSRTYLRLAGRCYATDNMDLGKFYLQKAIDYDPNLKSSQKHLVHHFLIFWVDHLDIKNKKSILTKINNNLPTEVCKLQPNLTLLSLFHNIKNKLRRYYSFL
jgi:glycosyltransferase involved in cell wall biosynthesis